MTVHSPINRKSFLSLTHSFDNTMKHNNTNIKSISKYLHALREQQKWLKVCQTCTCTILQLHTGGKFLANCSSVIRDMKETK